MDTESPVVNADEGTEFDFPLFSAPANSTALRAVSLKEDVEELPRAIRPDSYYFASPDENSKCQIQASAVTYAQIFESPIFPTIDVWPQKVVSLKDLNRDFTKLKLKNRLGLAQRRLRNERREKVMKLEKLRIHRASMHKRRGYPRPRFSNRP